MLDIPGKFSLTMDYTPRFIFARKSYEDISDIVSEPGIDFKLCWANQKYS